MRAFDAGTGNQLWAGQLPWGQDEVAPPTALGGTVYSAGYWHIVGAGGYIAGLKEADGTPAWPTYVSTWGGRSSPAVSSSDVYVSTVSQPIDVSASNGGTVWGARGGNEGTPGPAGKPPYEPEASHQSP